MILRIPTERSPRFSLFSDAVNGRKMAQGGQKMAWQKGVGALPSRLTRVGPVRIPSWGPEGFSTQ